MAKDNKVLRIIVDHAERSRKFEWVVLHKNNRRVCVSDNLYTERYQAVAAAKAFAESVNATTGLKLEPS